MIRISLLLFFLACSFPIIAQTNYMSKGNEYLNAENYIEAEKVFREAIQSDPNNLAYQCQLSLALTKQKKYADAHAIIDKVLLKDSMNVGALWYGGTSTFENPEGDLRTSIAYFEKVLPLLDKKRGQYFSSNWYIGRAYQILLQTDGLSYNEVTRMLDCYSMYVELQPQAENAAKITSFIKHIKEIRPPDNVKKWKNISQ